MDNLKWCYYTDNHGEEVRVIELDGGAIFYFENRYEFDTSPSVGDFIIQRLGHTPLLQKPASFAKFSKRLTPDTREKGND